VGPEPEARPERTGASVHNSRWVQGRRGALTDPPRATVARNMSKASSVLRKDKRVLAWTLERADNTNGASYGAQEPADKD